MRRFGHSTLQQSVSVDSPEREDEDMESWPDDDSDDDRESCELELRLSELP